LRLQYKPLKDPRTGERRPAWHWDLVGPYLPPNAGEPGTKRRALPISDSREADS
jgi:hypothetical protein